LKIQDDEPLSNFAFNFNLRRYSMERVNSINKLVAPVSRARLLLSRVKMLLYVYINMRLLYNESSAITTMLESVVADEIDEPCDDNGDLIIIESPSPPAARQLMPAPAARQLPAPAPHRAMSADTEQLESQELEELYAAHPPRPPSQEPVAQRLAAAADAADVRRATAAAAAAAAAAADADAEAAGAWDNSDAELEMAARTGRRNKRPRQQFTP